MEHEFVPSVGYIAVTNIHVYEHTFFDEEYEYPLKTVQYADLVASTYFCLIFFA